MAETRSRDSIAIISPALEARERTLVVCVSASPRARGSDNIPSCESLPGTVSCIVEDRSKSACGQMFAKPINDMLFCS